MKRVMSGPHDDWATKFSLVEISSDDWNEMCFELAQNKLIFKGQLDKTFDELKEEMEKSLEFMKDNVSVEQIELTKSMYQNPEMEYMIKDQLQNQIDFIDGLTHNVKISMSGAVSLNGLSSMEFSALVQLLQIRYMMYDSYVRDPDFVKNMLKEKRDKGEKLNIPNEAINSFLEHMDGKETEKTAYLQYRLEKTAGWLQIMNAPFPDTIQN